MSLTKEQREAMELSARRQHYFGDSNAREDAGLVLSVLAENERLTRELTELRERDRTLSRQLERRASGRDPLTAAIADERDALLNELVPLRAHSAKLREALAECATGFERACVGAGSDPEFAAIAAKRYRDLLAETAQKEGK